MWFQSNLSPIMAWLGLVVGSDITDGGLPGAGDLCRRSGGGKDTGPGLSTVQYSAVQYSTVQYSTVQYSTVQYSTVQYSTEY